MSPQTSPPPEEGSRRRRLGALTALVAGLFLGLTLLPVGITGPVGGYIGHALWQLLGAGALGIPLLGIGLALAGFDRLGGLDMKRSAILIVGLSVLVPYVVGVLAQVTPADLDMDVGQRGFAARSVGLVPGFLAETISAKVGVAGAVLLGFLALSALTLATFAWHPLQRLEAGQADRRIGRTGGAGRRRPRATSARSRQGSRKMKAAVPACCPPCRPSARPPDAAAPKPARKKDRKPELAALAAAARNPTHHRSSCSPRPRARTSTRARPSSTGWGSRCWRRSAHSRSRVRSPAGRRGRW